MNTIIEKQKLTFSIMKMQSRASRTLVMGDPHGGLKAIQQVLDRCYFNFEKDTLIVLGDVADGWPEVAESFEFLIENVKKLIYVRGNHDQWLKDWLKNEKKKPNVWTMQGGQNSIKSYERHPELKKKHYEFLKKTNQFYIDDKNRVFVHGGVDLYDGTRLKDKMYLMWDRHLWEERGLVQRFSGKDTLFSEVFVGHTSIYREHQEPARYGIVTFMDTGGGWEGKLSVMDIDTKEIWQSDLVSSLYPDSNGRLESLITLLSKNI